MTRQRGRRRFRWPRIVVVLAGLGVAAYVGQSSLVSHAKGVSLLASQPAKGKIESPKRSVKPVRSGSTAPKALPTSYLIHVPAKDQYPQLPNGCEVTSLAMLMTAVGHPVSKMTLAAEMPVDPTKLVLGTSTTPSGQVVHTTQYWGNPNVGFVGNVYKAGYGYGIYNGPMYKFLNRLLPGRAENLTGKPFSTILAHVAQGIPVEVWTTTTFQPTTDWVTWNSPEGLVTATPYEHAVLIVGYKPGYLYINNPLNGEAGQKVAEAPFIQAWDQLGHQAITVR